MLRRGMMAILCVVLTGSPVLAQKAGTQELIKKPKTVAKEIKAGNVSLDFLDADIRNVLKILSLKSGVNIVAGPEVTGAISIELEDVPWKQALDVILQTYGYAYEQKGNIIMVTTVDDLKLRRENAVLLAEQEPLDTKTFTLNFAKASDVIISLDKMKSERGSIDFDSRTNMLIITDIAKKIDLMAGIIKKLDRTTPQVLIEAKIIETTLTDTDNLGIDWTTKVTVSGSKRAQTWPFSPTSAGPNSKYLPGSFPGMYPETDPSKNTQFIYGTLNYAQTQAVFEMLRTKVDTDILSNPRIVTLDNQKATINIGDDTPVPSFGANKETGQLQTTGIVYRNIGINFEVTPHVNDAEYVTLEVIPEVSEKTGDVIMESVLVPVVSVERASTQVIVKSGRTLVIAGLIKTKTTDTRKKMPFLGDIPVLGLIFQKKEKTVTKRDLLIFITPHIITPEISSDY